MKQCEESNKFCGHEECVNAAHDGLGNCTLSATKILLAGRYLVDNEPPYGQGRSTLYVPRHVCIDCYQRFHEATEGSWQAWEDNLR